MPKPPGELSENRVFAAKEATTSRLNVPTLVPAGLKYGVVLYGDVLFPV